MQEIIKGKLCIVKTIDQEMIIGTFIERKEDDVILENPMSIYFQDPLEANRPPRIYLSKYNMFGNNRFTNISKYSIITVYESGDVINGLYEYYINYYESKKNTGETIQFLNSDGSEMEDDEYSELTQYNKTSNTTFH